MTETCELKERLPMKLHRDLEASAARGAKLLDKHNPRWFKRIKTTGLKMADGCNCIYGQLDREDLFDEIADGNIKIGKRFDSSHDASIYVGYLLTHKVSQWAAEPNSYEARQLRMALAWDALQEEWLRQIAARRGRKIVAANLRRHLERFVSQFGHAEAYREASA